MDEINESDDKRFTRTNMESTTSSNPFDALVSGKDPFPDFQATIAYQPDDDEDEDEADNSALLLAGANARASGVDLDWSIDTIAEMKPMAFSPLPEQKQNSPPPAESHANASLFFEDETQYKVLRTPSPLIRQQESQSQSQFSLPFLQQRHHRQAVPDTRTSPLPPSGRNSIPAWSESSSSNSYNDLHRRCRDAIAFCADRVRERQLKINRLQLPHPKVTPTSSTKRNKKRRHGHDSEFPWSVSPSLSTSAGSAGIHPRSGRGIDSWKSAQTSSKSPFSVPLTPIARQTTSSSTMRTPPSTTGIKTNHTSATIITSPSAQAAASRQPEFAFDGSPISPIAPVDLRHETIQEEEEKIAAEGGHDKENFHNTVFRTPTAATAWGKSAAVDDSISLRSLSMLHDSSSGSGSSSTPSFMISTSSSSGSSAVAAAATARVTKHIQNDDDPSASAIPSIAKRQEAFMAAIEAEANAPSVTRGQHLDKNESSEGSILTSQ
uniref:Uncharacterized protein n=1 Tax=Globisporangium ultimum (strain ATCC 200006 / CBS 805.95 / DAOM BR144) TaxID=431595 RepID=K3WSZ9_GLOUD